MAVARSETIVDGEEGLYHCVSRCVRRAFLCGEDQYTGRSFDHRKAWVQNRLALLAGAFGIEVCAFAVMSNHLHVVLRTRPDWVLGWSDLETAARWLAVFPVRRDSKGRPEPPSRGEIQGLTAQPGKIKELRARLGSISWFMRCLNENIARRANREDECKGRFWEGRFYCQALLDDAAVMACMTYVDLNPIRAGAAGALEESVFTSAYLRIKGKAEAKRTLGCDADASGNGAKIDGWLCPIQDQPDGRRGVLDMSRDDYLGILDWTGRCFFSATEVPMPRQYDAILGDCGIEKDNWFELTGSYGKLFFRAAGGPKALQAAAGRAGRLWLHGLKASRKLFKNY